ncbi:MAG TPA: hypothetical protein VFA41_11000 [Ktedonobacteraceae bacterium]|nr:hypothetical protein [Ktedonobacteraceae bacterium]
MRIDTLSYNNAQTQGARRRAWLREHSPAHLQQSAALMSHALSLRPASTSHSTAILGAGACTEIPLPELARASDEVLLADIDLVSMQLARSELVAGLQKRIRLLECDLSGGVSNELNRLLQKQPWEQLARQGARAFFDAAALCLEQCPIPDPPQIAGLGSREFGLVISSLVLSQLFSYPLLDILDLVQRVAPSLPGEQERHRRYQEAAQSFRVRIIQAHLHLLRQLLDVGGLVVLLTDVRGFAFEVYGTDHDEAHRRYLPVLPRNFPELVHENFTVVEEAHWEWITDLPEKSRFGRGYEVAGYCLAKK